MPATLCQVTGYCTDREAEEVKIFRVRRGKGSAGEAVVTGAHARGSLQLVQVCVLCRH